jgi:O-acetyl-ADP-ribose deacetylase (regulator of RNase III)
MATMVKIRGVEVCLQQGDITQIEADAIVNAANNRLWMGAGVAGAIKRVGGRQIEEEAVAQGPVPVGEAVVTTGGELKAKHVIHAAAMGQDLHTDEQKIAAATRSSLKRASEWGLTSVAFPALGTGVGRFPMAECAKVMLRTTVEFLDQPSALKRITFVLYDEGSYKAFRDELTRIFSLGSRGGGGSV